MSDALTNGNLWTATAAPAPDLSPLTENASCDLCVIGGGFTGLSAALHAAEAGARVILLEAHQIGHGGSGRNVGLVNAGLWTPPEEVEATLGPREGQTLMQSLADAPELVFSLIAKHGITCEATRNGTLHLAHSAAGLRDITDRHRQQAARGAPVELLSAAETARRTGTTRFYGALLDHRAGTIQPLSYARGLAHAARRAGAVLHDRSPVSDIRHDGGSWVIHAGNVTVQAGALIRATNGYHEGPGGPDLIPMGFCQFATDPLPGTDHILPGGEGCWDTATVMTSVRRDQAGRLLIGAIGRLDHPGATLHQGWARRMMRRLYPEVKAEFRHGWWGRIVMTADHMPKIESLGPNALAAYGYAGRGIAPGTQFGRAMAQALIGGQGAALPVAPSGPRSEMLTKAKGLGIEAGALLWHTAKARV
ncbi:NAD(P)/FAD-dependent oxidoreductase [Pseudooceanicola sp. C21-150M6]|uniref:NAD(P)/FAD-dependent oxidoreductase n=1 Tax=Pseudooceanicola sp. C21-150M6 TaxID=3434355 RepID=UPI003D7F6D0C